MSVHDFMRGHILISDGFEESLQEIKRKLSSYRVVEFIRDDFKLEDAKSVVAESYVSETDTKYIVFAGKSFTKEAQNSLLKVLEEPPKNIEFIIIAPTKSTLLPTIRSRLPIVHGKLSKTIKDVEIDLLRLDYEGIFNFLKLYSRVKKSEAKEIVEALYNRAIVVDKLILNERQLDSFEKAYKLLELNSRPQSVFAFILMSFMSERYANT